MFPIVKEVLLKKNKRGQIETLFLSNRDFCLLLWIFLFLLRFLLFLNCYWGNADSPCTCGKNK